MATTSIVCSVMRINIIVRTSYIWRFRNSTSVFRGKRNVPKRISCGTPLPSSNLTSYVKIIRASNALTSLTAKKRPGLLKNSGALHEEWGRHSGHDDSPRVSPKSEGQVLRRYTDRWMPSHRNIAIPVTAWELREAKAVKSFRIRVYFLIHMNSTGRNSY